MSRCVVLLIAASLGACASAQPVVPQVVKVPVIQYVPVPDGMTKDCPIAMPSDRTIGTLVGVAYARRQALEQCNRQLNAIRQLGQSR